jgi:hypothetical protein
MIIGRLTVVLRYGIDNSKNWAGSADGSRATEAGPCLPLMMPETLREPQLRTRRHDLQYKKASKDATLIHHESKIVRSQISPRSLQFLHFICGVGSIV